MKVAFHGVRGSTPSPTPSNTLDCKQMGIVCGGTALSIKLSKFNGIQQHGCDLSYVFRIVAQMHPMRARSKWDSTHEHMRWSMPEIVKIVVTRCGRLEQIFYSSNDFVQFCTFSHSFVYDEWQIEEWLFVPIDHCCWWRLSCLMAPFFRYKIEAKPLIINISDILYAAIGIQPRKIITLQSFLTVSQFSIHLIHCQLSMPQKIADAYT